MMLARLKQARQDGESGFTLIELLVVVAIIGILAAIAIPVFLNQRSAARDASVKSDINGIAKFMETYYTTKSAYPTDAQAKALAATDQPKLSTGNTYTITVNSSAGTYTIVGCNAESKNQFTYDSANGGLKPDPTSTTNTCSATAGAAGTYAIA